MDARGSSDAGGVFVVVGGGARESIRTSHEGLGQAHERLVVREACDAVEQGRGCLQPGKLLRISRLLRLVQEGAKVLRFVTQAPENSRPPWPGS